eukprot:TRINITY_DN1006_c0_g1_i1.p1 TRINITY_DN1006_c0_g1~~TRINITY_DN1006_c0_g1_i1.p1  ORF type:complete len:136 (+),score=59.75 TRINITY_DN1006_c0_g1_i1:93-500(+)
MLKYLVLALLAFSAGAHDFKNCGSTSDPLQISSVTLTPDPPTRGNLQVAVTGKSGIAISSGTAVTDISYLGIKIASETDNLCSLSPCPVAPGTVFHAVKNANIPSIAPGGAYEAKLTMKDGNGNQLGCFIIDFSL